MSVRVIPRLDVKGPNLVKGVHLEGLRVLGKPERFARMYYEAGADELFFMDAVASLYGRNSLTDIVERVAREVFIPLTVGGGLRSVEDIRGVLRSGADKVAINTAAIRNPELIREAARRFGSSTVVVAIDAIRTGEGRYEAFVDYGREQTGVDVFAWAVRAVELGAGEIVLTSVDREGTGKGYDLDLIRRVAEAVPVPVVAAGGAGCAEDARRAVTEGKADAVAVASILHYEAVERLRGASDDFSKEGNVEFLKRGASFGKIKGTPLAEIKAALAGTDCRPAGALR